MDSYSLGLDIGSISVNTVLVDPELQVVENHYDYDHGRPFHTLERVLSDLLDRQSARGLTLVATTGSGGRLAAELLGGRFVALLNSLRIYFGIENRTLDFSPTVIVESSTMSHELVVSGGLVVYPEKTLRADVGIDGERITELGEPGQVPAKRVIDAAGCYVLPGVIDPHTHPVYLDDIASLSRSAAFGGVTTIAHYAYAKPGQSLLAELRKMRAEGEAGSCTDFALHGGLFETLKQAEEIPGAFELGVSSFKMFMAYAKLGWMTDDYAMARAMDLIGRHGGLACIHAETGLAIDYIQDRLLAEKADFAERFLETSPDVAEAEGIFRAVSIGRLMRCPVYIPHVSSAEGLAAVGFLRERGARVYAETCPQYLGLTWEQLKARGALGKVGPAIKTEADRKALWEAARRGVLDTIGSDHAPKPKTVEEDFFQAAYGSPEVETMMPVVWHYGVNAGLITPNAVSALLAQNSARILGLAPRKGRLEPGADADLVVFDPAEPWTVTASGQHTKCAYSLFEGKRLVGRVKKVMARGSLIVDGEDFLGRRGAGRFLATRAGEPGGGGGGRS
jgi:dihydropyrimidinase